ncbi:MAG: hypothetical protein AB7F64_08990 [Gammaproteobacteria bacterium]
MLNIRWFILNSFKKLLLLLALMIFVGTNAFANQDQKELELPTWQTDTANYNLNESWFHKTWHYLKENHDPYLYPWSVMLYEGWMTDSNVALVITSSKTKFKYGTITQLEGAYQLPVDNWLRRIFQPFVSTVNLAASMTLRADPVGTIVEFEPYILLKWEHFPWDKYVLTSLGFGEGVSYVSKVPYREIYDSTNCNAKRFLNYLQFEVALGAPKIPNWRFVVAIHHRSGAYGLYGAGNVSSNVLGFGLRYFF